MPSREKQEELIRHILILCSIVLIAHFPFVNQAYHGCDWLHVSATESLKKQVESRGALSPFTDPLHIYRQPDSILLRDGNADSLAHSILTIYWLAAVRLLAGFREPVVHGINVIFPFLFALGVYFLGRRFARLPFHCAAVATCTPAVMLCSQTLSGELMSAAFTCLATVIYIRAFDYEKVLPVTISVAFSVAAFLSSPLGVLSPFLILLYWSLRSKKMWWLAMGFIFPTVLLVCWWALFGAIVGQIPPLDWLRSLTSAPRNLLSSICFLGGVFIFSPCFVPFHIRSYSRGYACGACFVISLVVALLSSRGHTFFEVGLLWLLSGAGLFMVYVVGERLYGVFFSKESSSGDLLSSVGKYKDDFFLCIWFFSAMMLAVLTGESISTGKLLFCLPPLAVYYSREVRRFFRRKKFLRSERRTKKAEQICLLTAGLSLCFGALLCYSHAEHAAVYRQFTNWARDTLRTEGGQIFFLGDGGLRIYMERIGCTPIGDDDSAVRVGDVVVVPRHIQPGMTLPEWMRSRTEVAREVRYRTQSPIRVMDFRFKAGFFSSDWGSLPFAPASGDAEIFEIRSVIR